MILLRPFSIVTDVYKGMSDEDCKEVEIIGWLYQFYISEWNEELIQSKKAYKKDEIAPASQLFTPKWIVQYMVDNTLGQLWSEIDPSTKILKGLQFYI
jgi:type II restriction/modification system DNA methylase subunit YeeA